MPFKLHSQQAEFKQLLSINLSEIASLGSHDSNGEISAALSFGNDVLSDDLSPRFAQNETKIFKAYAVAIQTLEGYTFHVADYRDGSRIVTCLDGEMVGYQGIALNGEQVNESKDVEWFSNYFVHTYPGGKVYSYPKKQTVILN